MKKIAGTGHRPDKLGGYDSRTYMMLYNTAYNWLAINRKDIEVVISGMALGWDQALAEAALDLKIPVIAAIPCYGQESKWPQKSKDKYKAILSRIKTIHIVSPKYTSSCMQDRNVWMVDKATDILALYNGDYGGGTYNCIQYAQRKNKNIINLWDHFNKHRGSNVG